MIFARHQLAWALALIALAASARASAGPTPACVRFKARADTLARVYLETGNPVIFEIGKIGLPWRRINEVRGRGHVFTWQVKKDRAYEIWDGHSYARAQAEFAADKLGRRFCESRSLLRDVLGLSRLVQRRRAVSDSEQLQMAQRRLECALAVLLGIRIEIHAGVKQQLWPQCPLPVSSSFECSRRGVSAKLAAISVPDNWQIIHSADPTRFRPTPGKPHSSRIEVRVPGQAVYYPGGYPVIARYDVRCGGAAFQASNAVEASVIPVFRKQAWIESISDTQIDLHVRLSSLLPVKNVETELYLPDGWTGKASRSRFDVPTSREIVYRITRPKNEEPGLRIVAAIFRIGDYVTSKRLITDHALVLGDSVGVAGLRMVAIKGEEALVTEFGRKCRKVSSSGQMYFDVSDNFSPGNQTYVTVECASGGPSSILIEYRTAAGKLCSTRPQAIDPASTWQHRVFVLNGAVFAGGFPGRADLRVRCEGSSLDVAGIRISRFRTSQGSLIPAGKKAR